MLKSFAALLLLTSLVAFTMAFPAAVADLLPWSAYEKRAKPAVEARNEEFPRLAMPSPFWPRNLAPPVGPGAVGTASGTATGTVFPFPTGTGTAPAFPTGTGTATGIFPTAT